MTTTVFPVTTEDMDQFVTCVCAMMWAEMLEASGEKPSVRNVQLGARLADRVSERIGGKYQSWMWSVELAKEALNSAGIAVPKTTQETVDILNSTPPTVH